MASGVTPRSDWRRGEAYEYLTAVERTMFAWEWLRRTTSYQRGWLRSRSAGALEQAYLARRFHLVELVDPELGADSARPIWRGDWDPHVVLARASAEDAGLDDLLDIRRVCGMVAIGIDDEDVEHWRIGSAAASVRLDVRDGTLLGGPTLLHYDLAGLARLSPKLIGLHFLARLNSLPEGTPRSPRASRAVRWIAELRVADALSAGATQQEIARALFGAVVPRDWRAESDSYRYRVQRLVRAARRRLAAPLEPSWFR